MPKTRQQKEESVKAMLDKIKRARSIVFTNFAGLKVKEVTELRRLCRQENVDYLVIKKTLMDRAFKAAKIKLAPKDFPCEVATVFGYDDEVAPARILVQYAKDHPVLKPFGGIFEQNYIRAERVIEISSLPSKRELLTRLVGLVAAPVSGFVNVLSGNLRGLMQVLSAVAAKGKT